MKAYKPEFGYRYQIFVRCPGERAFEHCDYARDKAEKAHLLTEYRLAYGPGFEFRTKLLPFKYWKGNDNAND